MSYLTSSELLSSASFYYACKTEDILDFKKLAIGNGYVVANELMKQMILESDNAYKNKRLNQLAEDSLFLFAEMLLYEHL